MASGENHVPVFRRRRSGATDYKARRRAVSSGGTLLTVRVSSKNVSAQFIHPMVKGDEVISASHSRALRKLGWKGSMKSVPACYLLGLLAGKKAKGKGVEQAYLYNGPAPFIRGSRVSAVVKGVKDAGIQIPISDDVLPSEDKMSGKTTGEYAAALLNENREVYDRRFSGLIAMGFRPEEYAERTAAMKQTILEAR